MWHTLNRRVFPSGEPSIYQGNQIYGFSCPAFETGTTWNLISSTNIIIIIIILLLLLLLFIIIIIIIIIIIYYYYYYYY